MPLQKPIDAIPPEAEPDAEPPAVEEMPDKLLTLQEIADALNEHYHRLRPFAGIAGIGGYLGAVDVRGVKGVRYKPLAAEQFRRLLEAKDAKVITVSTALAYLANIEGSAVSAAEKPQSYNLGGNAEMQQYGAALAGAVSGLVGRMDRMLEVMPAAPEDRLVGREEAARLLACSPAAVSRYVRPVRRKAWKHSAIMAYIAGL